MVAQLTDSLLRVGWPPHRSHKPGASQVRILDPLPHLSVDLITGSADNVRVPSRYDFYYRKIQYEHEAKDF